MQKNLENNVTCAQTRRVPKLGCTHCPDFNWCKGAGMQSLENKNARELTYAQFKALMANTVYGKGGPADIESLERDFNDDIMKTLWAEFVNYIPTLTFKEFIEDTFAECV